MNKIKEVSRVGNLLQQFYLISLCYNRVAKTSPKMTQSVFINPVKKELKN